MKRFAKSHGLNLNNMIFWLIASLLLFGQFSLNAQDRSEISLFSQQSSVSTSTIEIAGFYDNRTNVRRIALVSLSEELLVPFHLRVHDQLSINLFNELSYIARILHVERNLAGTTTLIAKLDDFNFSYIVLSTTEGRSYGNIFIPETGSNFEITSNPLTLQHYLLELEYDPDQEPEDAPALIPPDLTDQVKMEQNRIKEELELLQTGPFDPATIDLLFAYTPQALSWADNSGGGLLNRMANKLAWGQLALNNSDVIVTLRLVLITETSYTETGDLGMDLTRFTGLNDGFMDEIHAKRNTVGADLCILFTQTGNFGGVAWLLNNINGRPDLGFSVTRITQAPSGFTFVHEIGHNLGCHHHKQQNVEPGPTSWINWPGNTWSAGWVWTGLGGSHYASIMSYTAGSFYHSPLNSNSYTRVPHFSNPSISFDGVASGHAADGDNASTIQVTKHLVAAYRQTLVDCKPCPEYDFHITPGAAWLTHSSSIAGNYDCKIYRIDIAPGNKYTFKTGCGDGASANFNSFLELYDEGCFMMAYNDNGCAPTSSIVYANFSYAGYAYLKVRSDTTGSGNFTLAYRHEPYVDPCSAITHIGGIGPLHAQMFTGGGTGMWFNSTTNSCSSLALGKQEIFSFDPPSNGWYTIEVSSANTEVHYQSKYSCTPGFWTCIGTTDLPASLGPATFWTGSTLYFMLEQMDVLPGSHSFHINLACGAVSNLSVLPGSSNGFASWTEPSPAPLNGYELTLFDNFYIPVAIVSLPAGSTSYNFTGLSSGAQYVLGVESLCGGGLSADDWTQFFTVGHDYGDAPEQALAYTDFGVFGNFPTCMSTGPAGSFIRHAGNHELYFGWSVDYEGDGNAGFCSPYMPYNMDECFLDGDAGLLIPGAYNIYNYAGTDFTLPCPFTGVSTIGEPNMPVAWGTDIDIEIVNNLSNFTYFSVLIDWNQNGVWLGPAEQVLINFPIPPGFTGPVSFLGPPGFTTGPNMGYLWARFSLTDIPVPPAWTGTGDFSFGETEDYLLFINSPPGTCDPPIILSIITTSTDATIDWAPPPALGYELVIKETGNIIDFSVHPAGSGSYSISGLTPGTTYNAFIRSDCGGGLFSIWEMQTFMTTLPPCDPPLNLTVAAGITTADLNWVSPPFPPQHGYEVVLIDQNGNTVVLVTVPNSTNNYHFVGLIPNSFYTATVTSLCAGGLSASTTISFTTDPAPFGEDFGDAPDGPYPTLLSSNGARHLIVPNMLLGNSVDPEPDGQPDPYALGDDQDGNDDEDGVKFLNSFVPGHSVTIEFWVQGSGYINAWFDWNVNGSWTDPGDHTIVDFPVTTGIHVYTITVPALAVTDMTFARFRFSSQAGLSFDGPAPDGEVEDYRIFINPPESHKMHFPQYPNPAGWDVNITYPAKIADDWMCSQTGNVEDFHFWVSWRNDLQPLSGVTFTIEIYSDLPAHLSPTGYSMPDNLLWARDFAPGSYNYNLVFQHPQGWIDPYIPQHNIWDHLNCYRVDITNFTNPFLQVAGTVYWLAITAHVPFFKALADDQTIILYLNNIPPNIQPYEVWYEKGIGLSIQEHPEFMTPPGYILYPESGILLEPAQLHLDLSSLIQEDQLIHSIEFEIIEHAEPGATILILMADDEMIDMQFSTVPGPQTIKLLYADLPDKLQISAQTSITVRLFAFSTSVLQVWINVIANPWLQKKIGWKTSLDHFNDIAVRTHPDPAILWERLYNPAIPDSLSMSFVITGSPVQLFDFGDAPESAIAYPSIGVIGQFPTCMNLGPPGSFIQHAGNSELYFGPSVDYEADGNAGFCPTFGPTFYDQDECYLDGDAGLILPAPFTITGNTVVSCLPGITSEPWKTCREAIWGVSVDMFVTNTLPGTAYFNLLVDWNQDGLWNGVSACPLHPVPEHAVINFPVPPGFADSLSKLSPPNFRVGPHGGYVWARFTITEQPIVLPWDGSGLFNFGETEDYLFAVIDTELTQHLELEGVIFTGGSDECFEAELTITFSDVTIDSCAKVILTAGHSIHILPNTHIKYGAKFLATIDTNGNYCSNYKGEASHDDEAPQAELPAEFVDSKAMFRVFPNPTPGHFTLELSEAEGLSSIVAEIYNILGERILKQELPAMQQYHFDLSNHQPGIYLIRVMMGDEVGVEKIIRK